MVQRDQLLYLALLQVLAGAGAHLMRPIMDPMVVLVAAQHRNQEEVLEALEIPHLLLQAKEVMVVIQPIPPQIMALVAGVAHPQ
jgi:hypothetical protein